MLTSQLSPSHVAVRPFNGVQLPSARRSQRLAPRRQIAQRQQTRAGIELDWTDPDTLTGAFAAVLGIAVGIGAPLFYISRDNADDKRLSDLRELNRQNYKETGKYLTEDEIKAIRQPRWTDRREFQDDD
ncbi:hypothetical protein ABBQ32_002574 [Trebouxia sp. C0010 RCD-2024]